MRQMILICFTVLAYICFLFGFSNVKINVNRPPEIKIIVPLTNSTFKWNSILPYEIHVFDYEDGNSEYDEINTNEVLLVVKYLKDSSELKSYWKSESSNNYGPLVQMSKSTCLNCHKAKGKLIGPSFESIAAKYKKNPETVESLANKIMNGSSSVWGNEKMPPHPNITAGQVQEMVSWILENNSDSKKDYLAGIRGSIKTIEPTMPDQEKGIIVMTAIYRDHGSNNKGQNSIQAQDTLILRSD